MTKSEATTEFLQMVGRSMSRRLEAEAAAQAVDVTKVRAVYSGRPGCACGCRGKYSFASQYRDEAQEARGYEVTDDEVSDRSVKIIVGKINALIAAGDGDVSRDPEYISVDLPNRSLVAYFAKPTVPYQEAR